MKVSVIVPVYKTAKTLSVALDSVLDQSWQDFEIICVNDGSPDNAAEVLADYARKDSRIRVITQENRGLSSARNSGLDVALGEYVMFLDSDDALPNYALSEMVAVAASAKARLVVSSRFAETYTGAEMTSTLQDMRTICATSKFHVSDCPMQSVLSDRHMRSSACNKLYRRDLIGKLRFVEGIYFEDWPFVTEVLSEVDRVAIIKEPCYIYSKSASSIVRSPFDRKKVESYLTGIRHVADRLRGSQSWPLARKRSAIAAAMMINKVSRSRDASVCAFALSGLASCRASGAIRYRDLPLKSLWRLAILKFPHSD